MPTEKAETAMVKPPTDGTIIDAATPLKNATPIVASVAPRSALTAASALPPLQTNGNSDQPASPPMPPDASPRNGASAPLSAAAAVAAAVAAATQKAMASAAATVAASVSGASAPPPVALAQSSSGSSTCAAADTSSSSGGAPPSEPLPPPADCKRVRLKGAGLVEDDLKRANAEVQAAIDALRSMLADTPHLEIRAAVEEDELQEALKLYRDMNHLSLAGGITCESVVEHVLSHTVVLLYRPAPDQPAIAVTAATFTMRQQTMMLRLLATHPRMTRKGFGRICVHFLKELCRALRKTEILVYTYPSSSPFYKALHFRHTHPQGEQVKPPPVEAGANPQDREKARDARRVFSAKENEMIFHVQPSMFQILDADAHKSASGTHAYACTRRRSEGGSNDQQADGESGAASSAAPSRGSRGREQKAAKEAPAHKAAAASIAASSAAGSGRGRKGRETKRSAAAEASAPAASSSSDGKAERWLASVNPLFNPGDNDSDGEGVETTVSPRKRPRLDKDKRDEYAVERIVDVQRSETDPSDVKYLIKWKGWPTKYNTWEPLKHLKNLQQEIEAFESTRR